MTIILGLAPGPLLRIVGPPTARMLAEFSVRASAPAPEAPLLAAASPLAAASQVLAVRYAAMDAPAFSAPLGLKGLTLLRIWWPEDTLAMAMGSRSAVLSGLQGWPLPSTGTEASGYDDSPYPGPSLLPVLAANPWPAQLLPLVLAEAERILAVRRCQAGDSEEMRLLAQALETLRPLVVKKTKRPRWKPEEHGLVSSVRTEEPAIMVMPVASGPSAMP